MDDLVSRLLRRGIEDLEDYVPGRSVAEVQAEFDMAVVEKMASNENPLGPSPLAPRRRGRPRCPGRISPLSGWKRRGPQSRPGGAVRAEAGELLRRERGRRCPAQPGARLRQRGGGVRHPVALLSSLHDRDAGHGRVPVYSPLRDHSIDLGDVRSRVTDRTKLVFLCNPNNPTGTLFSRTEFEAFLGDLPETVVVVLDEAYADFVEGRRSPPPGARPTSSGRGLDRGRSDVLEGLRTGGPSRRVRHRMPGVDPRASQNEGPVQRFRPRAGGGPGRPRRLRRSTGDR